MNHNPNFSEDELEYLEPENLDTQRQFRQPTKASYRDADPDRDRDQDSNPDRSQDRDRDAADSPNTASTADDADTTAANAAAGSDTAAANAGADSPPRAPTLPTAGLPTATSGPIPRPPLTTLVIATMALAKLMLIPPQRRSLAQPPPLPSRTRRQRAGKQRTAARLAQAPRTKTPRAKAQLDKGRQAKAQLVRIPRPRVRETETPPTRAATPAIPAEWARRPWRMTHSRANPSSTAGIRGLRRWPLILSPMTMKTTTVPSTRITSPACSRT